MNILSVVVYLVALLSYLGLILYVVIGSIRAYRTAKKENEVRWHMLFEYLETICHTRESKQDD